ncbi:prenyltransferase [Xylariaceae sp. FL1019]|nr:prenyltransferase [Xylariaceae sp. FL1019]
MPVRTSLARARLRSKLADKKTMTRPRRSSSITRRLSRVVITEPAQPQHRVPSLFTQDPPIIDDLVTDSSKQQEQVIDDCVPLLSGFHDDTKLNKSGVPSLSHHQNRHVRYLKGGLGPLPSGFKAADASRPWFFYWSLNGLALLGVDVAQYRVRLVDTARSIQNESGGFGGGFGQHSHLATTYAMVLALAIVGGESAYEVIDRRAMWKWLGSLKQADGGFQLTVGGEVDVRGAYCAAVLIRLLNLPLDLPPGSPLSASKGANLFTDLAAYVRRCQTFEGGISARPGAEAHGAYAFCALGCLAVLDAPNRIFPKYLDMPRLISWLSSRQYAPEGGFCGRTNKLVDGCYSHWVGGCWPLIATALQKSTTVDVDTNNLYSREGLIRYILCCCQDFSPRGGLRDKPTKTSDAYHTCYVLSGLSAAQHTHRLVFPEGDGEGMPWDFEMTQDTETRVYDAKDLLSTLDPVYVIPPKAKEDIMSYFSSKTGF